jgi:hypothetical protein
MKIQVTADCLQLWLSTLSNIRKRLSLFQSLFVFQNTLCALKIIVLDSGDMVITTEAQSRIYITPGTEVYNQHGIIENCCSDSVILPKQTQEKNKNVINKQSLKSTKGYKRINVDRFITSPESRNHLLNGNIKLKNCTVIVNTYGFKFFIKYGMPKQERYSLDSYFDDFSLYKIDKNKDNYFMINITRPPPVKSTDSTLYI